MSRHVESPLEHGELEASPFYSPEMDIEINVADDSQILEVDSNEPDSPRPDDDEDLGPDIKPPQAKIKKDKHKHKHRGKSDRSHDRHGERLDKNSKHGGRSSTGEIFRARDQKERGGGARGGGGGRWLDSNSGQGEWDRRARLNRQRDEEQTRREKSLQERERLERLEMERRRLDREISKREHEQREKVRKEREAEKDRLERIERKRVKTDKDDGRRAPTRQNIQMWHDRDRRPRSRSPQLRRDNTAFDNGSQEGWQRDRNRSFPSSQTSYKEPPTPMEQRASLSQKSNTKVEEISSEGSDSGSEGSSSGDSDSGSDSSSEGDSKENTKSKDKIGHPGRVKSRFDSETEPEQSEHSDHDSAPRSDRDDDDYHEYNDYLDETPPQSPMELKADLPPYYPAIQGCRNVEEFNCLYRIEEGTFGVVYGARDKKTDEVVALKRLKMEKEKDGFPITSLREINTLLKAQHPNIVTVREIVVGSNMDRIYIVMDYVEHDLKDLMGRMKEPFLIGEVKTLMLQLLRGVSHLHDNWIIHRDLKTSNLLLSHAGILKIGDFGLAREYGSPLKPYTPIVVTLWYRCPELLLGVKEYACPIDMWSVGCIMAEFLTRKPLFPGKSEIDELNRIFKELGTPNESIWPGVSQLKGWKNCTFAEYPYNQLKNRLGGIVTEKGFELMNRFLTYAPTKRITAEEAIKHEWFKEAPTPVDPSMFPTWPTKNEQSSRVKTGNSPKPPSGGKAYASLLNDEDDKLGFHLKNVASGGFSLKF